MTTLDGRDGDLSDHCLSDHSAAPEKPPRTPLWTARGALLSIDRRMHFTGLRGAAWRSLGVTRSPRNPNVCNLCATHVEAGRLSEVSVAFADCRGYTTLMRERGPSAVQPVMDEFFRTCSAIVFRHHGIVDHFLGDAVLALFNVPIRRDDHPALAVQTAIEIQRAVPAINARLGEGDLLKVGVGVSVGLAYCGTVGSKDCKDYTALGDAVNIASRLQGEAAPGEIIMTEVAYAFVRDAYPHAVERTATLKGVDEPVKAYVLNPGSSLGLS